MSGFGVVRTEVRTLLEIGMATAAEREALHKIGRIGIHTVEELLGLPLETIRVHVRVHAGSEFTAGDLAALIAYLRRRGIEPPKDWSDR